MTTARTPRTPKGGVHGIAPALLRLAEPVASLEPYPGNARTHDLPLIAGSLTANGQYRALVGQTSSRRILVGNGTLAAAIELGWTHVAVEWHDGDDAWAARVVLVDNAASDHAGYDEAALAELIREAELLNAGLVGTGFDAAYLAELDAAVGRTGLTDVDDAPPAPEGPVLCELGETWLLGDHRLVVGDCTDPAVVLAAAGQGLVDLVVTDPPYGVSYHGKAGEIAGDDLRGDPLQDLLERAFAVLTGVMGSGCPFYVFAPSGPTQLQFRLALQAAGLELRQELAWVKNSLVLGRLDYQARHESILAGDDGTEPEPGGEDLEGVLYGWVAGKHLWRGGRRLTSVWEYARPAASKDHPTMKPVAMLADAIANSSKPGALVLDVFAGSGSTLIACHQTLRRAALVEIDPRYAHVVCRRWQEHTGVKPVREGTRRGVDFTRGR